ncbi:mercuric reductase [bacterium]|nr:mercuric reductase [bacterium]
MEREHFDDIVIGTGQAGKPLAIELAGKGRHTAIIEKGAVGGTCVNVGCTPTKTMVASARNAWLARRGAEFGVKTGDVTVSMEQVRARKRAIVHSFSAGGKKSLETTKNLELIRGTARFLEARTLQIELQDGSIRELVAKRIFINTGNKTLIPPIPGLNKIRYLDSTSIMELEEVPERLVVLGGGYIGLEFGQMFRRFGSEVVILQRGSQLLMREDEDIAEEVTSILREDGLDVRLNSDVKAVEQSDEGGIRVLFVKDGINHFVEGSHLLVAVGRTPNTKELDLPSAGIVTDSRGAIRVNEQLETSVAGVYALGDVKGGPAFTHIAYDDYRILRSNLLEGGRRTTNDRVLPYTVFIDPQLARVGISEREALASNLPVRIQRMKMSHVAMALERDEARGLMKVIVHKETGHILGFAVVGAEGGELMSTVQVAMMGNLPYTTLRDAVFTHPSFAESLNNIFTLLDAA